MTGQVGRTGVLLSQAALGATLIAGAVDGVRAHDELSRTVERQHANDELVGRIDAQLDALAKGTRDLAQQGDANAAAIVDTLAQGGVRIAAPSQRR